MKELLIYAPEVLVCSIALLLACSVLLERRTAYLHCRIYLIGATLPAALIPALSIPVWAGDTIYLTADPVAAAAPTATRTGRRHRECVGRHCTLRKISNTQERYRKANGEADVHLVADEMPRFEGKGTLSDFQHRVDARAAEYDRSGEVVLAFVVEKDGSAAEVHRFSTLPIPLWAKPLHASSHRHRHGGRYDRRGTGPRTLYAARPVRKDRSPNDRTTGKNGVILIKTKQ